MVGKAVIMGSVDKYIAKRLQLRRVMLGMTQTDLAKRCGISFQQIQKYERGQNQIPLFRLHDMAKVFKMSDMKF